MPLFSFDNTYARLPDRFYARVAPTPVRAPRIVKVNRALAELLRADVERLDSPEGADVLAGNAAPEGAEPIALAYAGHQFGGFVPQLGDGRALLLGEVVGRDGRRRDIQLKGSGRTPFSRGGDGRAAIGPVLREYVVSDAMAAMGIPTTRSLAAVTTGEPVIRDEPLPGAVLTRVASSHLRVGTFQYFAARRDKEALVLLTAYAIDRHYPDAASAENPALTLVDRVATAQAELVASWLGVGFVHGVMNTDNCSIAGETLDYGPCAFLDEFDPTKKFSSIDHGGRYAFGRQPAIAQWNVARFAEALLPLLAEDEGQAVSLATSAIERFAPAFEAAYGRVVRRKLGLVAERAGDVALANDLFERLATSAVDYTVFFRKLCACAADPAADAEAAGLFADPGAFYDWALAWRKRLTEEAASPDERAAGMRRTNPAFIPRNHRIEQAIVAAEQGDFAPFEQLVRVLARPYDDQPGDAALALPPSPHERVRATFCGT
jgi:uncharacterized protein YdiU (UPF0061 family)